MKLKKQQGKFLAMTAHIVLPPWNFLLGWCFSHETLDAAGFTTSPANVYK
jgi:hypothetical protein